jgi:hypothetical protein
VYQSTFLWVGWFFGLVKHSSCRTKRLRVDSSPGNSAYSTTPYCPSVSVILDWVTSRSGGQHHDLKSCSLNIPPKTRTWYPALAKLSAERYYRKKARILLPQVLLWKGCGRHVFKDLTCSCVDSDPCPVYQAVWDYNRLHLGMQIVKLWFGHHVTFYANLNFSIQNP